MSDLWIDALFPFSLLLTLGILGGLVNGVYKAGMRDACKLYYKHKRFPYELIEGEDGTVRWKRANMGDNVDGSSEYSNEC